MQEGKAQEGEAEALGLGTKVDHNPLHLESKERRSLREIDSESPALCSGKVMTAEASSDGASPTDVGMCMVF